VLQGIRWGIVPLAMVVATLGVVACSSDSPSAPSDLTPVDVPGAFSEIQARIFTPLCISHHGVSALDEGLDLRFPQSYDNLVNVPSRQSTLMLVAPGNPEGSYLLHKLDGRPGIADDRMPPGGPVLNQELLDLVRSWIAAGASNN